MEFNAKVEICGTADLITTVVDVVDVVDVDVDVDVVDELVNSNKNGFDLNKNEKYITSPFP